MKRFKYTKFFGWFAVATLLLTTSCKDDLFIGNNNQSDEVTVSFTLTPEAAAGFATRGAEGEEQGHVTYPTDGEYGHISDGSKADILLYALYDKDHNLLEGYSNGQVEGFDHGKGQSSMKIEHFPVHIKLTLKRGEQYTIAFWAQSQYTKAYNTADLRKVEVNYSEIGEATAGTENVTKTSTPNNDEYRDAFCRSVTFVAGGESGLEQNVLLYRPLAQINVGTSGFDFETITRNADKKYLYSKIRLNRVARYLDVVKDSTYSSTTNVDNPFSTNDKDKTAEAFAVADFGYAPIPAYVNYINHARETGDLPGMAANHMPEYPSYTVWDWDYQTDFTHPKYEEGKEIDRNTYKHEEFLKVHLYDEATRADGNYTKDEFPKAVEEGGTNGDGYLDYANLKNNNEKLSETFKYLSMCYVLTSSTKDEKILINNVKMWMATSPDGDDEIEIVNLNNVPAQRNWRTNIIGNLLTEENTFSVTLDRDFAGEYNGWGPEWEKNWSGPLAKGVYYDAEKDEIQISDKDGLIWFQKMVNGDLKVRENKAGNANFTEYYPYYDWENNTSTTLPAEIANGISEPTDEKLKARILKATHQDHNENSNNGWPEHNNFHFCGSNGPAHVKLMADIDLFGVDWIPIGFDFKVHDTSVGNPYTNVGKTNEKPDNYDGQKNHSFDEAEPYQRAFCGQFDGNNHTISNLTSMRFAAKVHDNAVQKNGNGPYDNVQWFPTGFFGMVGGCGVTPADLENDPTKEYTKISNLRLFNVDIYGYHTGAGIAAIVNSIDDKIDITNCMVDGGTLELSPMYRGDTQSEGNTPAKTRTFARGIYLGGIVGQYVADGEITGCEVRNVTLRAYRQLGGLVGSVSNQEQADIKRFYNPNGQKFKNLKIHGNMMDDVLLIADKFQPYDSIYNVIDTEYKVWRNGFGWKAEQKSLANPFVGGTEKEVYIDNTATNVQFAELSTGATTSSDKRVATIGNVPLKHIPMLSSWFCDEVNLTGNYYGKTVVRTGRNYHDFAVYSHRPNDKYSVPFNLPFNLAVDYDAKTAPAGMYVETVTLDGEGGLGGRSLITPDGLNVDGACVMYVTSRDRKQFYDNIRTESGAKYKDSYTYKKPTIIKNVVLRGAPWAWAGMLFEPNDNMTEVVLESVAIYDVYQTLALKEGVTSTTTALKADKCNFRGYTVPGAGWKSIDFTNTTFEEGTYTKPEYKDNVYVVDLAETTFTNCFFKAPYFIELNQQPKFERTYATSASNNNEEIKLPTLPTGVTCKTIKITSSPQGDPIVTYIGTDNKEYDKAGNVVDNH